VHTEKPRIIGLDVGDRRIGIAISDPLGITAAGLDTYTRKNMATDVAYIADLVRRHHAVEVVIGMPYNMDGSEGEQAMKVMSFGKKLARALQIPIIYEDEWMSTITAIRTLVVQKVKTGHNRDLVDRQAAAIILQRYLDKQEPGPSA
jgi:putative Holliday junction resolvase